MGDTEKNLGGAIEYVPTLGDKVHRFFGYRFHHADEPPDFDPAKHIGWMKTVARFEFDWADRLRLLVTGRLRVEITQHTTQQVDESVNSVGYQIFAPFEGSRKRSVNK